MIEMKGLIKNVTGTHGGLSPCLLVDCSDDTQYTVPRSQVTRAQFRGITILIAESEEGGIVGIAKVLSFENEKVKSIVHIVGRRFKLEDIKEFVDCRNL